MTSGSGYPLSPALRFWRPHPVVAGSQQGREHTGQPHRLPSLCLCPGHPGPRLEPPSLSRCRSTRARDLLNTSAHSSGASGVSGRAPLRSSSTNLPERAARAAARLARLENVRLASDFSSRRTSMTELVSMIQTGSAMGRRTTLYTASRKRSNSTAGMSR